MKVGRAFLATCRCCCPPPLSLARGMNEEFVWCTITRRDCVCSEVSGEERGRGRAASMREYTHRLRPPRQGRGAARRVCAT